MNQHRPVDWRERGFRKCPKTAGRWFLDVYDPAGNAPDSFQRLTLLLREMAAVTTRLIKNRPLPLILVPAIGVGAGEKDAERGGVIRRLLEVCDDFTRSHAVDVAVVTPNRAAYSALQHQRMRSLALFIGAGASVPAGLPSWDDLLEGLVQKTKLTAAVRAGFKELFSARPGRAAAR